ncbi:hypothetical protein CC86DRAFT_402869 [Ophiobolus disseminans]|uniref:Uncharacterized protein n=1 Tax=Ophiobolus disseminans TaxID=1469910 RepID=A0A6A7ADC5_9PLEO|nr:hypothetical protein CC86DRAFT_402869 [Ophiobolus disseminans]
MRAWMELPIGFKMTVLNDGVQAQIKAEAPFVEVNTGGTQTKGVEVNAGAGVGLSAGTGIKDKDFALRVSMELNARLSVDAHSSCLVHSRSTCFHPSSPELSRCIQDMLQYKPVTYFSARRDLQSANVFSKTGSIYTMARVPGHNLRHASAHLSSGSPVPFFRVLCIHA